MPDSTQLAELVQQIKALGIDPSIIPEALAAVQAMQSAGLAPSDVADALVASMPTFPEIPAPEDPAPLFAFLQFADDPTIPLIPDGITAVLAAIDAADYAATVRALVDLFRADLKSRPHVAAAFAQQKADVARRTPPEPAPVEIAQVKP